MHDDAKYVGYENSINAILKLMNKKHLQNEKKTLNKGTFFRYYSKNITEREPCGQQNLLPDALLNLVRLHIKMMQLSKSSPVSGRDIDVIDSCRIS